MADHQQDMIRLDCPRCGAPLNVGAELLTCEYCGARLILKHAMPTRQTTLPVQRSPNTVSGIHLKPYDCFDPQANLAAFSLLIPEGWQVRGGVTWLIERPASPTQISFQAANPGGLEAFEILPSLYFTWTNNPLMLRPEGSLYFGYEFRQPVSAREAMHKYILPRYRRLPDLQIVDEGPAQELLQAVVQNQQNQAQAMQYSNDSIRVRLQYSLSNAPVAEEMSAIAEYFRMVTPGLFGGMETVYMLTGYLTSFRAGRERLESCAELYRTIVTSFKVNPAWDALVKQVTQGLTSNQIRHINQIGALSRQISQNYNEMSDASMRSWQERNAAMDRVAEKFSQTIRGVDPYYDPNKGQTVELPGGYTQAWSTPLGEYVLSDDPTFDPNIGSNQTFTPLTPPEEQ